ncbi:MAG: insulinase family protein, partial [Candidatus Eisenbacteria bacterium]|nr:insulinase family protein [Candidatus Eisenbacteria bacterium]
QVLFVEKDAPATAISIGYPYDLQRRHPDYWPMLLANHWFGEHRTFYGRLMNAMRVDRGLNYGDYSYIESYRQGHRTRYALPNILRRGQFFSIWIRPVEAANSHFALRQALRELTRLALQGIPEKDFATAKRHLLNYSKLWNQGLQQRLGMAMDDALTGTDVYISRIESELARMTLDDVNAAIKRHLQADNVKVAMVCSNARNLAEAIFVNAQSPIVYASGSAPEGVLEKDLIIQDYPLRVTDVEIIPADEIFRTRAMK